MGGDGRRPRRIGDDGWAMGDERWTTDDGGSWLEWEGGRLVAVEGVGRAKASERGGGSTGGGRDQSV